MKNVTVTLPEETALWLRVRAARDDRSVSRWLAERVEEMKLREDGYELAMERQLSAEPRILKGPGDRYPSRNALHDRARIR